MTRAICISMVVAWLGACVPAVRSPRPRGPDALLPRLIVDSPRPGALISAPEVDVEGRVETYDGRAWVHAESTAAELRGARFVARRVPLREGEMNIKVSLADGRGERAAATVRVMVENPDRPRPGSLCRAGLGCLRYEERGVPQRDAEGRIVNAVVVLAPFGFDERLDELWPDLVGPGRALDSRKHLVLGVAGAAPSGPTPSPAPAHDAGGSPGPDAFLQLFDALITERALSRQLALIGAPSYGAELALRALARGTTSGPVLICGGHDRPFDEPAMQATAAALADAGAKPNVQAWLAVARVIVPASYGRGYLDDARHAPILGVRADEARAGLAEAAAEQLGEHFARSLPISELDRRMRAAFELRAQPITYPDLHGRRVLLVANSQDRMMTMSRERALALRLRLAGASVSLHAFADELGHSVFFHRVPLELELAVRALTTPATRMAP